MDTLARIVTPATIAREAIRQLVASKIAPTPENFARAYGEAAGEPDHVLPPDTPEQVLKQLAQIIVARHPGLDSSQHLHEYVTKRAWKDALDVVEEAIGDVLSESSRQWPPLMQRLLAQLDTTHTEWTHARKLAAVRHVLTNSTAGRAGEKIEALMAAWAKTPGEQAVVSAIGEADLVCPSPVTAPEYAAATQTAAERAWRLLALTALDTHQAPTDDGTGATADARASLSHRLAKFAGVPGGEWLNEIQSASVKEQAEVQRQTALRERLVNLLRLACENMVLFADDDAWVRGQVECIAKLLDTGLDELAMADAEESLRRAVERQSALQADLKLARVAMKEMLAELINHLAAAATTTDEFHRRIGDRANAIKRADDLPSLSLVVASLLDDTLEMRDSVQQSHRELSEARERTQQFETRVQALEQELVDVSGMLRIDPLTQVLNRRGLEEAFAVELARAERERAPLAVALLDIDNFKYLNDSFGHQTGDRALKYVSDIVRGALRTSDTVARYGGEEFVILLPATSIEDAVSVLTRTQRQLTREFFLHNNEKILITFSVGITDFRAGDSRASIIKRADDAVYVAKAAGKNRVHVG
jgi:diguanylate cyclase